MNFCSIVNWFGFSVDWFGFLIGRSDFEVNWPWFWIILPENNQDYLSFKLVDWLSARVWIIIVVLSLFIKWLFDLSPSVEWPPDSVKIFRKWVVRSFVWVRVVIAWSQLMSYVLFIFIYFVFNYFTSELLLSSIRFTVIIFSSIYHHLLFEISVD